MARLAATIQANGCNRQTCADKAARGIDMKHPKDGPTKLPRHAWAGQESQDLPEKSTQGPATASAMIVATYRSQEALR